MSIRHFRFAIGRRLVHAGLRAMPPGPARAELYALLDQWGSKVIRALSKQPESAGIGEEG